MTQRTRLCPGPVSRRQFARSCLAGLGGVGVGPMLAARAAAQEAGRGAADTAVIFIWLPGGPSHLETFDMKPDAPAEIRGDFRPTSTNVPGVEICEHLPRLARCADRYALIRSIAHEFADHGGGHKRFLTGRKPNEPTGFVNDHPCVGSMVAKVRDANRGGAPNYVTLVDGGREGIDTFSFGAAYLGPATYPFSVAGDPSQAKFEVRNLAPLEQVAARFNERCELIGRLDRWPQAGDPLDQMEAVERFRHRALELMTSDGARRAFDLRLESDAARDRYGRNRYGHRALMARRLVEAGSSFVTVVMENPGELPADTCYNWDSHAVNCDIFKDCRHKFPWFDQAISALVEDLYQRGLDKKVMLIVTGEFGRTPRLENQKGRPGRDHWPQAMSVLVSGGGMPMGQIIGSTNGKGEHPQTRPLAPNDLWATMFRHLGIDPETTFPDHAGRPMPILAAGEPIRELVS